MNPLWQKLRATAEAQAANVVGPNPPWKAKSVWFALVLMLLGGGFWIKDRSQASDSSPPGGSSISESATSPAPSSLQPKSPATFRFGASYLGGFFIGWTFRRFLKLSLLVSGAAIALVALGKKTGWLDLDWNALEGHVQHSMAWVEGGAGSVKAFLTGFLPSAGAAGVGGFFGFRRK